jgi:hypothetical protein
MLEIGMIMRAYRPFLRNAAMLGAALMVLSACDSALTPFVGQSKEAAARSKPQAAPPGPPPSAAFITDKTLSPGYAGHSILPPTLPADDTDDDTADDSPATPSGPRHALAAVPLSTDQSALVALGAAVKREAAPDSAHFVLLVLSPPAADAAALDKTNTNARLAAAAAVKMLGDAGVATDRVEVSMATSPNADKGELRLYRR